MKGNQRLNFDYKIIRYSIRVDLQAHNLKIKKKKSSDIKILFLFLRDKRTRENNVSVMINCIVDFHLFFVD